MIRKLHKDDIDSVANIWLNTNIQSHRFIDEQYWKKNYELVKKCYWMQKYMFMLKIMKFMVL